MPPLPKLLPLTEEAAEVEGEVVEIVGEEAEVRRVNPNPLRRLRPDRLVSVDPNTLTFHQGSGGGAGCTIAGGSQLIFVRSPPRVLGRTFTPQSLQNEDQTSSAKRIIVQKRLINCYMTWIYRKYIL